MDPKFHRQSVGVGTPQISPVERREAQGYVFYLFLLLWKNRPPQKKTNLLQFKKKPKPNIKPVQQRKCHKSHTGAFKHLQAFFSDKTHGNNFFVLHKPRKFHKIKNKNGVTAKNATKVIKKYLLKNAAAKGKKNFLQRKTPVFFTENSRV